MYRLQKQAKTIKKELRGIHIESEADDMVSLTLTAEFELVSISITENAYRDLKEGKITKERLEEAFKKAINKALKKAQEISGQRTKGLFQDLGIGG